MVPCPYQGFGYVVAEPSLGRSLRGGELKATEWTPPLSGKLYPRWECQRCRTITSRKPGDSDK
jgi:hypothetical protein